MPKLRLISLLLVLVMVCACGDPPASAENTTIAPDSAPALASGPNPGESAIQNSAADLGKTVAVNDVAPAAGPVSGEPLMARELLDASFHADAAEGNEKVQIDLSQTHLGYVAVSIHSDKRFKFQVIHGEATYTYDVKSDGTPSIFPLQTGDGEYTFRAMENVEGKKYAQTLLLTKNVKLDDPFQPFLRPSDYSRYTADSLCVLEAADMTRNATNPVEIISVIYAYINKNIRYDHDKAATVKSGYLPNPDDTLRTKKGICFDYASLAAAMLRSQGIPCKVIFGYVAPNQLYHAWNMFYTEETGWVTVSFKTNGKDWTRLDLTFTANGQDDAFIGDGSNYSDLYFY